MANGERSPMANGEPGEHMSRLELEALADAPSRARHHTTAKLREWLLCPELIETAEILVSELVTNAIKAAGSAREEPTSPGTAGRIALTLQLFTSHLVIGVFDYHAEPPILASAEPDAESGRGLLIVSMLSKRWGHFLPQSGGKVVYAELEIPR